MPDCATTLTNNFTNYFHSGLGAAFCPSSNGETGTRQIQISLVKHAMIMRESTWRKIKARVRDVRGRKKKVRERERERNFLNESVPFVPSNRTVEDLWRIIVVKLHEGRRVAAAAAETHLSSSTFRVRLTVIKQFPLQL